MAKTGESYTAARRQLIRKSTDELQRPVRPTRPSSRRPRLRPPPRPRCRGAPRFGRLDAHCHRQGPPGVVRAPGRVGRDRPLPHRDCPLADNGARRPRLVVPEHHRQLRTRPGHAQARADGRRLLGLHLAHDRRRAGAGVAAFTDAKVRRRWLPDAPMRQRPTRAALTARFDWADPTSRVVVVVGPKGAGKSVVTVTCEQVPDADAAESLKPQWRASLGALKALLGAELTTQQHILGRPRS